MKLGFELIRAACCVALCMVSAHAALAQSPADALSQLTRQQHYTSKRASSAKKDLAKNQDNTPIEIGQTVTLADLEGPGVISHIWCTVASKDPFYGRSLVVRIYWDGAEKPSVEVPLGDFFGVGNGANADVDSIPVSATAFGRSRSCFWQMPFKKRALITVTSESKTFRTDSFYYYVDWQKHESLPDDISYFHARYNQAYPAMPGDYTILETEGKGHYVGTVLSVLQTEIGWFGEGDDRFYIDGEEYPSLSGTGTEDYFNDAWGFREFCRPYFGVPVFDGYQAGDRVSAYRWHIADPVAFQKSLKVQIEHFGSVFTDKAQFLGQFFERPDWVSSVAYWYQATPNASVAPIAPVEQRMIPYRVLTPRELTIRAEPAAGVMKTDESVGYLSPKNDAIIEVEFEVADPGRYQVNAIMSHQFLGGLFQAYLDGKPVGPVRDFYLAGEDSVWERFDQHVLAPGKHVLKFEGKGVSAQKSIQMPSISGLGIDNLILLRLEDLAGYQEASKKALAEKSGAK